MRVRFDLALHIASTKQGLSKELGFMRIRSSIYEDNLQNKKFLIPFRVISKKQNKENRPLLINQKYISKSIQISHIEEKCQINEICLFEYEIQCQKIESATLKLQIQLQFYQKIKQTEIITISKHYYIATIQKINQISAYVPISFDTFNQKGIHASISSAIIQIIQNYNIKHSKQIRITNSIFRQYKSILKILFQHSQWIKRHLHQISYDQCLASQQKLVNYINEGININMICSSNQDFVNSFHDKVQQLLSQISISWQKYLKMLLKNKKIIANYQLDYSRMLKKYFSKSNIKLLDKQQINYKNVKIYKSMCEKQLKNQKNIDVGYFFIKNLQYFKNSNQTATFTSENILPKVIKLKKDRPLKHYIILVYGFRANKYDFILIKNCLKAQFPHSQIYVSDINFGNTEVSINYLAQSLSYEIHQYLQDISDNFRLSFIGHSMGGIIIRAAIPLLKKYQQQLFTYVSFGTPHLGYLNDVSFITKTGLWILSSWKKYESINQLTFRDHSKLSDCYLFKLSQNEAFDKFQNICFVSCFQDQYVPFFSSRIQKSQSNNSDIQQNMIINLLSRIQCHKMYRVSVFFDIKQNNIEDLIGRTGHIRYLSDHQFIKQFFWNFQDLFN